MCFGGETLNVSMQVSLSPLASSVNNGQIYPNVSVWLPVLWGLEEHSGGHFPTSVCRPALNFNFPEQDGQDRGQV